MSKHFLIFILPLIAFIIGCNKKDNSDQNAISELIKKYPELGKDTIGNFQLIRTVLTGNGKVGIKFYAGKLEKHDLIVLQNESGKSYAIPLFSNDVRKYWSFENEPETFKNKEYNSLFELEFVSAINELGLNDGLATGYNVIYEILHSVLHCQELTELDGEKLDNLGSMFYASDSNSDGDAACESRNKKNREQILQGMVKGRLIFQHNACFDTQNHRVFQFKFPKNNKLRIKKLDIKIYRIGCEFQMILL